MRPWLLGGIALGFVLAGCSGNGPGPGPIGDDDDDDSTPDGDLQTWYRDQDADGYGRPSNTAVTVEQPEGFVAEVGDCDDFDATVFPGAEELCDQQDNNCDGEVDEGVEGDTEYFADADKDGWGSLTETTLACDVPPGYVTESGDCDDGDGTVYPGAEELCDDQDNDCDGVGDEAHPELSTWHPDNDGDGYGDESSSVQACLQPPGHLSDNQDCDDNDPASHPDGEDLCDDGLDQDCDGTPDGGCTQSHCSNVTSDETWGPDVIHLVTCDIFVAGATNPALTIADGTTVRFAAGADLYVGYGNPGKLVVEGDSAGVLFTADSPVPSPGSWNGVSLWNQDSGSELTGLTVEYGGGNNRGNLRVNDASPVLTDVVSRHSSNAGLYSNLGSLTVSNSSFEDNDGAGVELLETVALDLFSANVMTGNQEPLVLGAVAVASLDSASSYTGNADDRIRLLGGDVEQSVLWLDPGVPVRVEGDIHVGAVATANLELNEGLELQFDSGRRLRIGNGGSGALTVSGGSAGVLFTSSQSSPTAGAWGGVFFQSDTQTSNLTNLTVEYGGSTGSPGIEVQSTVSATISLDTVTVRDSAGWGLEALGGSLIVTGSTFEANALGGVLLDNYAELAVTGPTRSFSSNVLINNSGPAMSMPSIQGGQVDAAITVSGNGDDRVLLSGSVTTSTALAGLPVPWSLDGIVYVAGGSAPQLTIDDGAVLEFESGAALKVGLGGPGYLYVNGSNAGVTFTSAAASPQAGDWDGVTLWNQCLDVQITGLSVEYGGGGGYGNLRFFGTDGSVSGGGSYWSAAWGIYRDSGANPTITGVSYANNASGDLY